MDTIELDADQRDAISKLVEARRAYPEADCFEHDGTTVRMPGARDDVSLSIGRETLRGLGHYELVKFDRTRDAAGRGRWRFDTTARATEFV
jgi:hypothetical protein